MVKKGNQAAIENNTVSFGKSKYMALVAPILLVKNLTRAQYETLDNAKSNAEGQTDARALVEVETIGRLPSSQSKRRGPSRLEILKLGWVRRVVFEKGLKRPLIANYHGILAVERHLSCDEEVRLLLKGEQKGS
ncbi:hypothetical protein EPI10_019917 [Gossypium australe]|uniref:Uncharacterized protein n=1 Tax=Gossypium australe TaxID=47621 RepID=A0A5B6WDN7_9ROSI|nr:hypothetical protein EPI10_019917 [Gossypium australe]